MHELKIKRIYEQVEKTDGYRILIDRLWPRGISKNTAHLDEWAKEVAPTPKDMGNGHVVCCHLYDEN